MNILGYSPEELEIAGAIYTGKEISGQPELWRKTVSLFEKQKKEISTFLTSNIHTVDEIILTGAGTSAFIGLSLKGIYQRITGKITESVSTTDLVTHPEDYLMKDKSILLISFARSGNSPESVAAARLADLLCKKAYHLIVTCDETGYLANYQSDSEKYIFVLPPESNDQSLAMTGSYSSMLLAGILMVGYDTLPDIRKQIETVCTYGERILNDYAEMIKNLVMEDFTRAVFLGSGPLFGTATESTLKLQELTDGKIICKNDSFLGFRHGPKAVVDEKTLVVYLFSNSEYVRQYEADLIKSMRSGKHPMLQIGICEHKMNVQDMDLLIVLSEKPYQISEALLTVCQIIPGQLIGFYKSLHLGNKPDSPSDSGSISRVVQGVDIYDYDKR